MVIIFTFTNEKKSYLIKDILFYKKIFGDPKIFYKNQFPYVPFIRI